VIGWSLLAGLIGPVPVVVAGVLAQDRPEVLFVVDQHPAGALGSCGSYPSLGVTVRPGRPRRGLHDVHARGGEDLVEDAGELGVAVADQEPERADIVFEVHEQGAGLLGGPGAIWVGGHAQDVDVPGRDLHDKQHMQTPQEDRAWR
jgi:hypothetical protein